MTWSGSKLTSHFMRSVGLSAAALLLSANIATAHDGHTNPTKSFNFDPQILCGDAKDLHAGQNQCYSIFAKEMADYAKNSAEKYLSAPTLEAAADLLRQDSPSSIEIDSEKKTIKATWTNSDDNLHRDDSPAYIKIDFAKKSYTEIWFQNGEFSRSNHMPTYMKYAHGKRIKLQWDAPNKGLHNEKGPAIAENRLTTLQMFLSWAVNGSPGNPIDAKGGPTYAEIDISSNVAYFQEFSTGDAVTQQRMHRHDCVYNQSRDRKTGAISQITFHYHDRNFETDDEVEVKVTFDPESGDVINTKWSKNDQPMDPPAVFNLPKNHYCQDPNHTHPAAKYQ